MYDLDDQGLIYHYSPESAKDLPDTYKYNDGMGHEVRAIYSVLAYNTTQIDKAPKDWDDVTTDVYKGSLAIANPAYSGGAMTTLSVHVEPEMNPQLDGTGIRSLLTMMSRWSSLMVPSSLR